MDRNYESIIWGVKSMISVGIDVSKGKSMVCIMKPYGEVIELSAWTLRPQQPEFS
jgi:hypothetical protein